MNEIVMGGENPMNVDEYSYKVEFQDRGAGHVHGTLWLRMDKIENLVKDEDRTLRERNENDLESKAVFSGLKAAFKKFRNNEKLTEKEISAVRNFIDEYTTVCTHENTVGREVARITQKLVGSMTQPVGSITPGFQHRTQ